MLLAEQPRQSRPSLPPINTFVGRCARGTQLINPLNFILSEHSFDTPPITVIYFNPPVTLAVRQ
jgi:hypothetical protein